MQSSEFLKVVRSEKVFGFSLLAAQSIANPHGGGTEHRSRWHFSTRPGKSRQRVLVIGGWTIL
jgi:hypothetical protein